MKWKIICAALLLTNAATATLWLLPKKVQERRAYRTEVDGLLAGGWRVKQVVKEPKGDGEIPVYILTRSE